MAVTDVLEAAAVSEGDIGRLMALGLLISSLAAPTDPALKALDQRMPSLPGREDSNFFGYPRLRPGLKLAPRLRRSIFRR